MDITLLLMNWVAVSLSRFLCHKAGRMLVIVASLTMAMPATLQAGRGQAGVQIADGRLTIVETDGLTLRKALAEIARQSGFELVMYGEDDGPVRQKLRGMPVMEAVKRLLLGANYFLVLDDNPSPQVGERQIKKVIVASGLGSQAALIGQSVADSTVEDAGRQEGVSEESSAAGSDIVWDQTTIAAHLAKLGEDSVDSRVGAVHALANVADEGVTSALAGTMLTDSDEGVRAGAAMALGSHGGSGAIEPLMQAVQDHDPWVRINAIESLARIGERNIAPLLSQLRDDADPDVANAAIMALRDLSAGPQAVGE